MATLFLSFTVSGWDIFKRTRDKNSTGEPGYYRGLNNQNRVLGPIIL